MTVINERSAYRNALIGGPLVSKATGTLASATSDLFVIAGGEVLITCFYGKVTTAITVANTMKLLLTPTTGASQDLCASTDVGTTDTIAGTLLTFGLDTTTAPRKLMSIGYSSVLQQIPATTGKIQLVSGGTDGAITWYCGWVPLTDGATLVAA